MASVERRIFGVDFSGAVDAGRKIWIAAGVVEGDALRIEECFRGEALPNSARQRDVCLAALRAFIARSDHAVVGLDFPLSLPHGLLPDQTWLQFIRSFADRFSSPEEFRHRCLIAANGRELKRVTDTESRTPFSPYNLRLYRQTYYGLRDLIGPLVADRAARVLPMQTPVAGKPYLIEICPASTLKRLDLYWPYKGRTHGHRVRRERILRSIQSHDAVRLARGIRSSVLDDPEGDALDSIMAAWSAFEAARSGFMTPSGPQYRREGWVFV